MKFVSTPDPSSRVLTLPAFRRYYAFHNQRFFKVCALRACFCARVRPLISLLNIYVNLGPNLIIVGSFKSPNPAFSFYIGFRYPRWLVIALQYRGFITLNFILYRPLQQISKGYQVTINFMEAAFHGEIWPKY
jgi:hypothetical protein